MEERREGWSPPLNLKHRPKGALPHPRKKGRERPVVLEDPEREWGRILLLGEKSWGCGAGIGEEGLEDSNTGRKEGVGLGLGEFILKQESPEKGILCSPSFWKSWEKGEAKSTTGGFGVTGLGVAQGGSNPFPSLISGRGTL